MSVYSISRKWESLPKLTIINDGSVSDDEIRAHIRFWKGELHIQSYTDSVNYHAQKGRDALVQFAGNHIFEIKMAIILHHAELDPVLWVDSDILFLKIRLTIFQPGNPISPVASRKTGTGPMVLQC